MTRARIVILLFGLSGLGMARDEALAPFVATVSVHAGLPPFEVRIVPGPPSQAAWNLPADAQIRPHPIGRVEITRRGEAKPFQTITAIGLGSPYHLTFTRFDDASFDGYADLLLGHDGGAKWGGYEIYFYDPASGTFVENALSREMSEQLQGNDLRFLRASRTIELDHLVFGCQGEAMTETFALQNGHLRKTGQTDLVQTKEGCYEVTRLLRAGGLKEVSRRRAPEHDRTD